MDDRYELEFRHRLPPLEASPLPTANHSSLQLKPLSEANPDIIMADFRSPIDSPVPSLALQMPQSSPLQHRRDFSGSITLDDPAQLRRASGDATAQEGTSTDARPGDGMAAPDEASALPATDPSVLKLVDEVLASEV